MYVYLFQIVHFSFETTPILLGRIHKKAPATATQCRAQSNTQCDTHNNTHYGTRFHKRALTTATQQITMQHTLQHTRKYTLPQESSDNLVTPLIDAIAFV